MLIFDSPFYFFFVFVFFVVVVVVIFPGKQSLGLYYTHMHKGIRHMHALFTFSPSTHQCVWCQCVLLDFVQTLMYLNLSICWQNVETLLAVANMFWFDVFPIFDVISTDTTQYWMRICPFRSKEYPKESFYRRRNSVLTQTSEPGTRISWWNNRNRTTYTTKSKLENTFI